MAQVIHQWSICLGSCTCPRCKAGAAEEHKDTPPVQFRILESETSFAFEMLQPDGLGKEAWIPMPEPARTIALTHAIKQLLAPKSLIEEQLSQEAPL